MAKTKAASTDPGFQTPRVDDEFEKHLPVRSAIDAADLEALILTEGCRDPLVVWDEENIVLEGHTRLRICLAHGVPYDVVYQTFAGREAILEWIVKTQLAKRNLTDLQRDFYIGKQYLQTKQPHGGHLPKKEGAQRATSSGKTVDKVAKKNKVSPRKVQKDAKFADAVNRHEAANPGSMKKILAGEAGASKTKIIKTAPVMCARCVRCGKVKDCSACEEAAKKSKKKPTMKTLFDEKSVKKLQVEAEIDEYEELMKLVTKTSAAITKFLSEEGEVAARAVTYLTGNALVDYPAKGTPRCIALDGVVCLLKSAGEKGPILPAKNVADRYLKACGALPWVPPAVKFRRAQKQRATNMPD